MALSRKDLLDMSPQKPSLTREEEDRLRGILNDAGIMISLGEHLGWKKILNEFINPRLERSVFLSAEKDELCCVQAVQRVLTDLLVFVNSKITDGEKAHVRLKNSTNRR